MKSTKQASNLAFFVVLLVAAFSFVVAVDDQFNQPSGAANAGPDRTGQQTVIYANPDIEALAGPVVEDFGYPFGERLGSWRIEFVPGEGDVAGYTWSHEYRIEVFIRPATTADDVRRVLAHELGHAVDVSLNSGEDRRAWQQARGIDDEPWWPESGAADFQTGAGDFAESFAFSVLGDELDFRSELGPEPTADQLELMASLASE